MQIIFSLLLVLAAIVMVGWLLKRINVAQQGTGNLLKVLGSVPIGQRERIVLVEVKDTWLVVGVGPSQIRTLHTLENPGTSGQENTSAAPSGDKPKSFSGALSDALGSFYQGKRRQPPEADTVEASNVANGRSRNAP